MRAETLPRPQPDTEQVDEPWNPLDVGVDFAPDTAPGAEPEQPDRFADLTTDPTDEDIEQQKALYELDREQVDRQILGKSVRLFEDTRNVASKTVSGADSLWARLKNLHGSPRKLFRKMMMNVAQNSLSNKEKRLADKKEARQATYDTRQANLASTLDDKHAKDQLWVDSATSDRQKRLRQAKVHKKHASRQLKVDAKLQGLQSKHESKNHAAQSKVDSYRSNTFGARKNRYNETAKVHADRLSGASSRAETRANTVTEAREAAIKKGEHAIARRELRTALRREHSTGRVERRAMINEIFGSGDDAVCQQKLAELGRRVVERQIAFGEAQKSHRATERAAHNLETTKSKLRRAESALETLPAVITKRQAELPPAQADAFRLQDVVTKLNSNWEAMLRTKGEDAISFMERAHFYEAIQEATNKADSAKRDVVNREQGLAQARAKLAGLPDEIAAFEVSIQEQAKTLRNAKAVEAARESRSKLAVTDVGRHLDDIFNPQPQTTQATN